MFSWLGNANTAELQLIFNNTYVYIIGKGPSLDRLETYTLDSRYPIIAINEAIHKVESLNLKNQIFCFAQDKELGASCQPRRARIIVSEELVSFYDTDLVYKSVHPKPLTVEFAIDMCRQFKILGFKMIAFDSCHGDYSYARCLNFGDKIDGWLRYHKKQIEKRTAGLSLEWL